jgi:hypothetical protein
MRVPNAPHGLKAMLLVRIPDPRQSKPPHGSSIYTRLGRYVEARDNWMLPALGVPQIYDPNSEKHFMSQLGQQAGLYAPVPSIFKDVGAVHSRPRLVS